MPKRKRGGRRGSVAQRRRGGVIGTVLGSLAPLAVRAIIKAVKKRKQRRRRKKRRRR